MTEAGDTERPRVGISRCLLGDEVRFNGGHKRDAWLTGELGRWVDWFPVCPEVEMGLGVPREPMRLERTSARAHVRLVGTRSGENFTGVARSTCAALAQSVPADLDGFILKNRSPSCGVERVKVYDKNRVPAAIGRGFFAAALIKQLPDLPVIEEGRLNNAQFREHFAVRVFAHHGVRTLRARMKEIQAFHQAWKFVLLAHHEPSLRTLGRLAANNERDKPSVVRDRYRKLFLGALDHPTDKGKRANAIQHIYGFVKDGISTRERHSVLRKIEEYRTGRLPYVAVVTLMNHLLEHSDNEYIRGQLFFSPYPESLRLHHAL